MHVETRKPGRELSRDLWLIHWPLEAATAGSAPAAAALATAGLWVETCQRRLALGLAPRPRLPQTLLDGADVLTGEAAWCLALEVATGLRSAVAGETNVFGQLRRAWAEAPLSGERRRALAPLVDALFADAREIRQRHLQGIGGSSYGSLARRLLAPAADETILLVGAGDLARSLVPFLDDFPLAAWNRRPVAADTLGRPVRWFAPGEMEAATRWARHVIFTTPADALHDELWRRHLTIPDNAGRPHTLLHLGRRRAEALDWGDEIHAFYLDDVFRLGREQAAFRGRQLEEARAACARRAAERCGTARPVPGPALLAQVQG
jgi:glutamyl-tRNA reductase